MNACIFWPNIYSIYKRARNIYNLNVYNEYNLSELYRQSWCSVVINRRRYRLPAPLPDSQPI